MKTATNVIISTGNRRAAPRAALLLATFALVCGPLALGAEHLVPFKASFTTEAKITEVVGNIAHISVIGHGPASFLGATTVVTHNQEANMATGDATATYRLTGAHGDSVVIETVFKTAPLTPNTISLAGSYINTSGTGRFAGVKGGGTFTGTFTYQTQITGVGQFTMTGTISPPGEVDFEGIRANAGATFAIDPSALKMTVDGVAQVSVLGNCSTHADAEMSFGADGSMQVTQSTFWFTSADGKITINAVADGPVTPDPANPQTFGNFHYQVTFIGGTGRFASVGGKGEIDGAALFSSSAPGTGTGTFTLKGVLELPEDHHHGGGRN